MKNKLYARIDHEGRLRFDDMTALAKVCAFFRGAEVEVSIGKRRKKRSLNENSYYWGVVIAILSEHTGYASDEMHDALRAKFLAKNDPKTGLLHGRSTSDLSTVEFEEYVSNVRKWACEQGVFIPLPNEQIY